VTFATGLLLGSIFGACLGFVALAVLRLRKSRNDESTLTPTVRDDPRLDCRATCQGLARLGSYLSAVTARSF
jgi:hypothetical protein